MTESQVALSQKWLSKKIASIFVVNLRWFEQKVFSQNGEDGVLAMIFSLIGTTNQYFVEFGVEDAYECNTRLLRERFGWHGLSMDMDNENLKINLRREKITAENINELFQKYSVPHDFDLLSIDIDSNDFYVWKALETTYRPRVVVIEYNSSLLALDDKVIPYSPENHFNGTNYFGAGIQALYKLGRKKGYSLIYSERRGVNLFFIRDDVIEKSGVRFKNINCPEKIHRLPTYGVGPFGGHPASTSNEYYVSAEKLLV